MYAVLVVESCREHWPREKVIRDTWGKGIKNLRFLDGEDLHVQDDYQSLPLKTRAICQRAVDMGYDYLCKLDTDTYVHVPRLLASGFEQYDYSGFVRPDHSYCYGPCYWLSRKAFTVVANSIWNGEPYEDLMVGVVLALQGIKPHHDERYSHWFPVLPENDKIIHHLGSMGGYSEERMRESHANAHRTSDALPHR